ncbi:hypothetical protein RFI_09647 [Reticulomyxa filosa]|uniref:Uncharacterized protein n=1 Tax=Reticulomyxa filosa TaxID=46433 RepID=X6NNI7_RETFI|nr:hypothetical protein RFI_09647 [Reticulomyxa filosa]|eukprot:ETO27488.1 hypothetical protein RFI_09647 [Reticulomyxa filosa]
MVKKIRFLNRNLKNFILFGGKKGDPPQLYCIVQPELLERAIYQIFETMLPRYYKQCVLAIITNSKTGIAATFAAFRDSETPLLHQKESTEFYNKIFCSNLKDFKDRKNQAPLVTVFLSQNECVGKTYHLNQQVDIIKPSEDHFVHVPINSSVIDRDFIVEKLTSAPATSDLTVLF